MPVLTPGAVASAGTARRMPGISCVHRKGGITPAKRAMIGEAMGPSIRRADCDRSTLLDEEDVVLCAARHSKYPVAVFESDGLFACVEGRIYGKAPRVVQRELERLSRPIFARSGEWKGEIANWLLDTDGDFIVLLLHKASGALCLFNDALARLPLFYNITGSTLVVSREPRFIVKVLGQAGFDRVAIAQYLLFGYPLGDATIFSGIRQLPPASMIRAGGSGGGISVEQLYRHNFDRGAGGGADIREEARVLADLLETACRDRHDPEGSNVVALSSGMDSRMVASCLAKTGLPFSSETFSHGNFAYEKDLRVAERVAGTLGCGWKHFKIGPARGEDALDLLRLKDGMNFLGMSFSLPLFRMIRGAFGERITLFTGDGGDKVIRDIRPAARIADIDALVNHVVAANQLMPLDLAASIARVRSGEILGTLRRRLESFDERDMRMRYVHFLIRERCMKWLFHGEDRNRSAFWQAAPFYSIRFFRRAMECPFDLKSRYGLYREILLLFSREAADIINTEWNLPVTSARLRFYWAAREIYLRLPAPMRRFVRARYRYHRNVDFHAGDGAVMRCFLE
ncbi:MAG: asparagine synthase-related protein, partial [Candidatus Krumholzibacteria bacterium]|nr:asparagine synthase-related protein [Candidatus Krumholzibacteria bacterium]